MLKKYLLGGTSLPAAGDGCYMLPNNVGKNPDLQRGKKSISSTKVAEIVSIHTIDSTTKQTVETPSIVLGDKTPCTGPEMTSPSILEQGREIDEAQNREQAFIANDAWKKYEIPQELACFDESPAEIVNIIRESIDQHRALRLSRLIELENLIASTPTIVTSTGVLQTPQSPDPSSASSVATDASSNRSRESFTTVESDTNYSALQPLPETKSLRPEKSKRRLIMKKGKTASRATIDDKTDQKRSPSHNIYKLFRSGIARAGVRNTEPDHSNMPKYECTSCFDEVDKYVRLDCSHRYCHDCFVQLVKSALQSETHFPPKCCLSEIPRSIVRNHLPEAEVANYDDKALEYAVPPEHRYYCISPKCSKFIDTRIAQLAGTSLLECNSCSTQICSMCRGPPHPGNADCPQDYGLLQTLEASEMEGWRRCYSCHAIVELTAGCRHITCTCRAEFCYTCGAIWRTCNCSEADQRRRERELEAARERREAEQDEIRRAIEAVAEAERQLLEEREAEEARERERAEQEAAELARLEEERVTRIAERFVQLFSVLREVDERQKQAIEARHLEEEEDSDRLYEGLEQKIAERQTAILAEKASTEASTQRQMKILRKKQALALMEIITKHRREQDRLLVPEDEEENSDLDVARAGALEALLPRQEAERNALKEQHAAELERCEQSGQLAIGDLKLGVKVQRMRFEEEEKMMTTIQDTIRRHEAELLWYELIHADREAMLAQDERSLLESGRDVVTDAARPT